jgi:hypothetical protein
VPRPLASDAEIACVLGISGDTFTVARATNTEPTPVGPIAIGTGFQVMEALTAKTLLDIEGATVTSGGGGGGGPEPARTVLSPGNLGAAYAVNFASTPQDIWIVETLNANCTITISNRVAGCQALLLLTQDATGGRTVSISDGPSSGPVAVKSDRANVRRGAGQLPGRDAGARLALDPRGTGRPGRRGGIASFNGRTGAVVPLSQDYTAAMVTIAADKSSGSVQSFSRAGGHNAGIRGTIAARFVGSNDGRRAHLGHVHRGQLLRRPERRHVRLHHVRHTRHVGSRRRRTASAAHQARRLLATTSGE